MFHPFRLIVLATTGLLLYSAFFVVPPGPRVEGGFDPEVVASYEVAAWQSQKSHQDFGVFSNLVLMQRELHRFNWFRAVQAGYALAHAHTEFTNMHSRFERVLPDLVDAETVGKDWMNASFDPDAVARARLNWWVTVPMPNLNSIDAIAALIAAEYAIRYQQSEDRFMAAAITRADAAKRLREAGPEPDWGAISRLTLDSYKALKVTLQRGKPQDRKVTRR